MKGKLFFDNNGPHWMVAADSNPIPVFLNDIGTRKAGDEIEYRTVDVLGMTYDNEDTSCAYAKIIHSEPESCPPKTGLITAELLIGYGFDKSLDKIDTFCKGDLLLQFDSGWWWTIDGTNGDNGSKSRPIEYEYQLKSLWSVLTREELLKDAVTKNKK